ncbi:hypothetical protein MFRU_044g00270 [Monilinia fructicola]|nr:hypothetical protein MFRU_044g00270 [Monilinia fructicola]
MTSSNVSTALEQCESLTYNDRTKQMLIIGQQSTKNPSTRSMIYELLDGSTYEQKLALDSCHGSQDVNLPLQYLAGGSLSKWLQSRAMHLVELLGTDDQILNALRSVPLKLQIRSLSRMKYSKRWRRLKTRTGVIDQYLEGIVAKEESSIFRRIFPLSSSQYVSENLPRLVAKLSERDWLRLATNHPSIVQTQLEVWINGPEPVNPVFLSIINSIVSKWTSQRPDAGLKLLTSMAEKIPISNLPLQELLSANPDACIKLVLEKDDVALEKLSFDNDILKRLSLEHTLTVFEYNKISTWDFQALTHEQRSVLYPVIRHIWRSKEGVLNSSIVSHLPNPYRLEEARRHITLSAFEAKPSDRISYIGLTPWAEGIELQRPFLHSKDAEIRSSALKCQIKSAMFDETYVSNALNLVIRYRNDQDPVRLAMLRALSKIPGGRWNEEHLPNLEKIIRQALEASDLSQSSIDSMLQILSRLLTYFPEWTVSQIVPFVKGGILTNINMFSHASGRFATNMIMDIVQRTLSPTLHDLFEKRDLTALLNLADLFSDHLKFWTEILDIFERAVVMENFKNYSDSRRMLEFLKKHRSKSFFRIVPQLLQPEIIPSIVSELILSHVLLYRQDLIPKLLEHYGPESERRLLFPSLCHEHRPWIYRKWTQKQQEKFASILETRVEEDKDMIYEDSSYIRTLGLLNFIDPKILSHLATSSITTVYESAIKALAKFDTGSGYKVILSLLPSSDDDGIPAQNDPKDDETNKGSQRAKMATYSLKHIIQSMSAPQAFKLLTDIPRQRITIGKEVIRLIGTLETDEAYEFLIKTSTDETLHPDSCTAVLQALSHEFYLSKPQTWDIYQSTASKTTEDDMEIQKSLLAIIASLFSIPSIISNSSIIQNILEILLNLLSSPSTELRIQTLGTLSTTPRLPFEFSQKGYNSLQTRLQELLQARNIDEQHATARVIYTLFASNPSSTIFPTIFLPLTKPQDITLKTRNLLRVLIDEYSSYVGWDSAGSRPLVATTSLILGYLAECSITRKLRIQLLFCGFGLAFEELKSGVSGMVEEGLSPDALVEMVRKLGVWVERRGREAQVAELEGLLGTMGVEGRRLALVCLVKGAERWGWDAPRKGRLEIFRGEEEELGVRELGVREAAWDVVVPGEGGGERRRRTRRS